jgi:NodT family efflux transporter outer membrane factor (OMF) lipoprotein
MDSFSKLRRAALATATAALAACTVGPNFSRPLVAAPQNWGPESKGLTSQITARSVETRWWDGFNDPELGSLVTRYVDQNLDIKISAQRIEQSRAARRIVAAEGLPSVDAQASYSQERESQTGLFALPEPRPGSPLQFDLWQDGLSAAWELDLFGRVRRSVEAADADTEAARSDQRAVIQAGLADLASDYLQLRGAEALEATIRSILELAKRNLALVRDQARYGVATNLDVENAVGRAATIEATLPEVKATEARLTNAVGLLLGETPRAVETELAAPRPQPVPPPTVPVGLPGDLVRRRPDVQRAEAELHAATAQTGVAIANFYPDVTLMGFAGSQSLHLADVFNASSGQFGVGPALSLPIFEGGRLRANLLLSKSREREAGLRFQKTVLDAWRDVDDAMTAAAQAQVAHKSLLEAERSNRAAVALARQRYAQGDADLLRVLAAEMSLLQARQALVVNETLIDTELVGLYRALGGGWEVAFVQLSATRGPPSAQSVKP